MSELAPPMAGTPFDSIRRCDADGEHWTARDLMPLLGYEKWERFDDAITRAWAAMHNSGMSAHRNASRFREPSGRTNQVRDNVRLSRYACYVIAMNGDPRKPEVAAAQTYFAIKAREAEVAPALTDAEIVHQALQITSRQVEALTAQVVELTPRAAVADHLLNASGDMSVGDAAKSLARSGAAIGATRLFALLDDLGWTYRSGGVRHIKQRAIEAGYLAALPKSHYHPKTGELVVDPPQVRVTPKGIARLLTHLLPAQEAS